MPLRALRHNRGARLLLIKTLSGEWRVFLKEKLKEAGLYEQKQEVIRARYPTGEIRERLKGGGQVYRVPRYRESEQNAYIESFATSGFIGEKLVSALQRSSKSGNCSIDERQIMSSER